MTAMTPTGENTKNGSLFKRPKPDFSSRLGRGDRSPLGVWFWELDRVLLSLILVLMAIGLLSVAAASPATARRLSTATVELSPLLFFYKQLAWVALALPVMFVISMYPRERSGELATNSPPTYLIRTMSSATSEAPRSSSPMAVSDFPDPLFPTIRTPTPRMSTMQP